MLEAERRICHEKLCRQLQRAAGLCLHLQDLRICVLLCGCLAVGVISARLGGLLRRHAVPDHKQLQIVQLV